MANTDEPMPLWQVIAILVAVGLIAGAGIGLLGAALGFSTAWSGAGVGAAVGGVGVALLNRRRKSNP